MMLLEMAMNTLMVFMEGKIKWLGINYIKQQIAMENKSLL